MGRARKKTKVSQSNYQGAAMSYLRTPEHRALRAQLIQRWKPWERSTGPRTAEGKAKAAHNAYKGGHRPRMRALMRQVREVLKEHQDCLDSF